MIFEEIKVLDNGTYEWKLYKTTKVLAEGKCDTIEEVHQEIDKAREVHG